MWYLLEMGVFLFLFLLLRYVQKQNYSYISPLVFTQF